MTQHDPTGVHYPIREDDANCPCDAGYWYNEDTGRYSVCGCDCHVDTNRCTCGAIAAGTPRPGGEWHYFDGTDCVGSNDYTN